MHGYCQAHPSHSTSLATLSLNITQMPTSHTQPPNYHTTHHGIKTAIRFKVGFHIQIHLINWSTGQHCIYKIIVICWTHFDTILGSIWPWLNFWLHLDGKRVQNGISFIIELFNLFHFKSSLCILDQPTLFSSTRDPWTICKYNYGPIIQEREHGAIILLYFKKPGHFPMILERKA